MSRTRLALAGVIAALVAAAPVSAVTLPRLNGTVTPDFVITLKKDGRKVTSLKRGAYAFVISDRGNIHNFHLRGPGINRNLTGIAFVGKKTVNVRLRPGRYTFYCVPHQFDMKGAFRVTL